MQPGKSIRFKEVALYTVGLLLLANGLFSVLQQDHYLFHLMGYFNNTANTILSKEQLDRFHPFIFIVGFPFSGTFRTREILNYHEDIRCGPEAEIISRFLGIYKTMLDSNITQARLAEAQVLGDPFDFGIGSFVLEALRYQGPMKKRICLKDNYLLSHINLFLKIFPNSQYILLLRDGRAVVQSFIERNISIGNFNENPWPIMQSWEIKTAKMIDHCMLIGQSHCLPVKYESLVQKPVENMQNILKFLNVPWTDDIMKYWEDKEQENMEESKLKENIDREQMDNSSLTSWTTSPKLPESFIKNAANLLALMEILEYNIMGDPPTYSPHVFDFAELEKAWENKTRHAKIER